MQITRSKTGSGGGGLSNALYEMVRGGGGGGGEREGGEGDSGTGMREGGVGKGKEGKSWLPLNEWSLPLPLPFPLPPKATGVRRGRCHLRHPPPSKKEEGRRIRQRTSCTMLLKNSKACNALHVFAIVAVSSECFTRVPYSGPRPLLLW